MRKKQRSVGDWPEVNRKPNELDYSNNAFDSMLKVTESDTTFAKGTDDIRWVKHGLDTGGRIRETWRGEGDENRKVNEREWHGEEGPSTGTINTSRQSVYYPDGSLKGEITYNTDQELRTVKEYYPDGTVKRDVEALGSDASPKNHMRGSTIDVNPTRVINSREYYPDGSIKSIDRGNKQGVDVGRQERYYPNGQLKGEQNYDDQGRNHGEHIGFKQDGRITRKLVWDHGRLISSSRHSKEEIDQINKLNGFN